ncbi:Ring finger domain protein [Apiospora arundinis]|uniref:Ring finger domain protein n=1 Tax=Apiospora arundinis TaxID=335852 RepID=A0ABR2JGE5_9PEZI
MLLDGEPAWLCLLCCKIDVLFNAFVLFWVTSTDSRDITTSKSRSNKSGDDSGRSRVTRLSFYTSWIRANMGQGPHPGRPFIIPPQATPPLIGSGDGVVDVNDDNSKESEDATAAASSYKADERRASIMTGAATATTTARSVAESSQSTKAPTKSILKSPPPPSSSASSSPTRIINNDPAAARLDYESCTEIWTGPEPGHPDPPGLDNGFAESLILGNYVAIYGETRAEMETETAAAATPMIMTKTASDHDAESL